MPPPTSTDSGANSAAYVYGVVPAGPAAARLVDGLDGLAPGSGVELVAHGDVAAVVSRVPLGEFGEDAIEERLRDPVWLAEKAQGHGRVLERLLGAGAIVPFRFGAIFSSGDDVRALLAAREGELAAELEHVSGKVELGVKAFAPSDLAERVRAEAPEARRLEDELAGAAAGRRYLLEKQLQQVVAREAAAVRAGIAEESHAELAASAHEATANPLQEPEVATLTGEMLLNGAYLVDAAAQREFLAVVDELAGRFLPYGARFEATGPWPPFNFVRAGVL